MEIHLKENVDFHFSKLVPTLMFVKVKRFGAFISPSWLCKASICLFWLFTVRSLSSTSFVNLRFCSYRAAGPWQWETNVYVIDVYVIFVCFVLALFTVIDHSYRHNIWWGKLFFSFLARDFPRNVAGNGRSKLSIRQCPMVYTLIDHRNDVKNIEISAVEPTGVRTMENCHLFVKGK